MISTSLDLRTLSIVLTLTTFSLSVLMVFIWRTNKTYPGFGLWAIANSAVAIGFFFLSCRGFLPDFVTIILANSFTFGSLLLTFTGTRLYLGLDRGIAISISVFLIHLSGFLYFNYVDKQTVARIIMTSGFLALISFLVSYDFRRGWLKEHNSTYLFASLIYLSFGILMIARAVLTYFFTDTDSYYSPNWVQSLSYLCFVVYAISWTFLYSILNNERLNQELKNTKNEFEKLATTDFLTGVNNNRRFFEIGGTEIQRAKRFRHPLTLIMFDVDFFKRINDTYGHAVGDRVLIAIVDICRYNLRELDVLGRLGGEEFGIMLPHTDIDVGKMVAGRLRRAFSETDIDLADTTIRITASFGVTELKAEDNELKELLIRADSALYTAKQGGRNQVRVSTHYGQTLMADISDIGSSRIM